MLLNSVILVSNISSRFPKPFLVKAHLLLSRFRRSLWRRCFRNLDWIQDRALWKAFISAARKTTPIDLIRLLCLWSELLGKWSWESVQNSSSCLGRTALEKPRTESSATSHLWPQMILATAILSAAQTSRLDLHRRDQRCFQTPLELPSASSWPSTSSCIDNHSY